MEEVNSPLKRNLRRPKVTNVFEKPQADKTVESQAFKSFSEYKVVESSEKTPVKKFEGFKTTSGKLMIKASTVLSSATADEPKNKKRTYKYLTRASSDNDPPKEKKTMKLN